MEPEKKSTKLKIIERKIKTLKNRKSLTPRQMCKLAKLHVDKQVEIFLLKKLEKINNLTKR